MWYKEKKAYWHNRILYWIICMWLERQPMNLYGMNTQTPLPMIEKKKCSNRNESIKSPYGVSRKEANAFICRKNTSENTRRNSYTTHSTGFLYFIFHHFFSRILHTISWCRIRLLFFLFIQNSCKTKRTTISVIWF